MEKFSSQELLIENQESFERLYQLYEEFNSHTNISAIRTKEEVFQKHFQDSLESVDIFLNQLLNSKERNQSKSIIDVGTGGGFPAIPLAIVFKKLAANFQIYALDATQKKLKFLEIVKEELDLPNLILIHARAEEFGAADSEFREYFDFAVARSVAHLSVLLELCIPLIETNGYLISYKNQNIDEEFNEAELALHTLKSKVIKQNKYSDKQLLIIKKHSTTPDKYPRSYSQIKNKSLIKD